MSFFSIGVGALNAAQVGMQTVGNNISNVSTDGYHRQVIVQASNVPVKAGYGFVGQGVSVSSITRAYSQFLDSQVLQAQTQTSSLNAYQDQISQIDNLIADPTVGVSPALQKFFQSVGNVATSPASIPTRQAMLSSASSLITSFQSLQQQFTQVASGVNSQITSSVTTINGLAQQIASVNLQIAALSGGGKQLPNDLMDTRDNLVSQLNQQVKTTTLTQSDGSYNVFIGNGQPLVVDGQAFGLTATPSATDPQQVVVSYQMGSSSVLLPNSSITGGTLGGLLSFRQTTLYPAENALGRTAIALAQTFNTQHALGQDLNGNLGGNFFAPPVPTVVPSANNSQSSTGTLSGTVTNANALTVDDYQIKVTGTAPNAYSVTDLTTKATTTGLDDTTLLTAIPGLTLSLGAGWAPTAGDVFTVEPTRNGAGSIALSGTINTTTIAAAAPISTSANPANTGLATIGAGVVSATTNLPQLSPAPATPVVPTTLTYDAVTNTFSGFPASFDVTVTDTTGASTTYPAPVGAGTAIYPAAGATFSFGGISVTMNGAPANNDQFTIDVNANGVADNRNALLLSQLQTANTMEGGTTSFQGSYSQMVNQVGNQAAEVKLSATAQGNILTQAQSAQQSVSGVNLDEEAAKLMQYQQAYQAAGKMLSIAQTLFNAILQI
jgi:flagellar hook-associated protein 1